MRKLLPVLLLLVIGILAIFFLPKFAEKTVVNPTSSPVKLTKLKIGIIETVSLLPYYVAKEKGYFTEEGLEVEAIPMQGGAVIAPAVASGDINIGWSITGSIIQAHDREFDFKMLGGGTFNKPTPDFQQFLVSADSDIKSPKDLEGRKFATNDKSKTGFPSLLLEAWGKKNGVDIDKIIFMEMPFPQMEAALKNKQVEAGNFVEPYATFAISRGVARVLDDAPLSSIADRFMVSGWFAKKSWIDQNLQLINSFNKAIEKSTKYVNENPQELPSIISKNVKIEVETSSKMILPFFDTVIRSNDLQPLIDGFVQYGYIEKNFPEQEIVDAKIE
ncbi:MAG: ABC transporter substrate-binding protein [Candidatus Curtissbacteria bacterium]|nr:ABC transporter substrate-binding protein [Candidatus Curtissbacteria bacterium]